MLKRNVIVGVGVIIRGRNLVLGGLCSGGLACFFGDSFGEGGGGGVGDLDCWVGDWGLGIECHVQGPIWVLGDRLVGWERMGGWLGVVGGVEQYMCWWERGCCEELTSPLGG